MTGPVTFTGRLRPAQPRRLHLVMRDATMIEGVIHVGEDQSLVSYLNGRRGGWMNLTQAHRPKTGEAAGHLIVQAEHIIIATAPDGNIAATATPATGLIERPIECVLVGGKTVRGFVCVAPQQRLSDWVAASGQFLGLMRATLLPDDRPIGDIALQGSALVIVRDLREEPIVEGGSAPEPPPL